MIEKVVVHECCAKFELLYIIRLTTLQIHANLGIVTTRGVEKKIVRVRMCPAIDSQEKF